MQFAALSRVDQDGAMAAGDERIGHDYIVIGQPADGVQADLEGINGVLVEDGVIVVRRELLAQTLDERARVGFGRWNVVQFGIMGVLPARTQQGIPGSAELIATSRIEVDTVEARI